MKVISGRNTSNQIANTALIHNSGHTTLFESTVYRNSQVQQINGNQYINRSNVHAFKRVFPDGMNFFLWTTAQVLDSKYKSKIYFITP